MKTAKEIIKRLWINKYKSTRFSYSPLNQDIDIVEKAMIEYANQKQVSDEEIEQYLNDLDNLIETGHFPKKSLKDYTFYHKDLTLKEFIQKGREFIRKQLTNK